MRQGNRPIPADFALVHDFPVGSKVWVWWGCQHWRRAVVSGHMGPWVRLELDGHPYRSKTYPRHHLLRHRFDDANYPSTSHSARYLPMIEAPLDMTTACAVATAGGTLVGWYSTEDVAVSVACDMAAKGRGPCVLLVPSRTFSVAVPPVREAPVKRRRITR
jgi:hypothetical protein